MDAMQLAARVHQGNGRAASRLGTIASHFRAASPFSPLKAEPLQLLCASFTTDYGYMRSARFGQAARIGIFDAAEFEVGDMLVSSEGTFYVAAMPLLQPILCVKAERLITLRRTASVSGGAGLHDYGGTQAGSEKVILLDWPASILLSRIGEHSPMKLPGETRGAWHLIQMPAYKGLHVHSGDFATDENAQRYVITGTELTDMGWRLTAFKVTV
ncbi:MULTISPECIES: hypothetical protein [unclassified Pantoea]|uniref:hypothetical protein n=1 Tax=unclassified Pantoea TaxID=2630326 RepID=UPI001CD59453|nr:MULTISPECIES: hypothetical protein [unclassified Pantoea]MCA1179794.1 hypothetical protein [Pantoea sp. alder69]MCA1253604.1 hypothetical protein [Pantoea sp. alder70]MCA1268280.1 hypothetical protein [Pantoea sp. alder81]